MKSKLALATVMFSLTTCGFAAQQQAEVKCPDISELKSVKFSDASAVYDTNLWEVAQPSGQYGTKHAWNFKVNIEADDKSGAMQRALATLESMRLINGPEKIDDKWLCHYRSGQHDAVAVMNLPAEANAVASADEAPKKNPA
jgi:hypothetical protein